MTEKTKTPTAAERIAELEELVELLAVGCNAMLDRVEVIEANLHVLNTHVITEVGG